MHGHGCVHRSGLVGSHRVVFGHGHGTLRSASWVRDQAPAKADTAKSSDRSGDGPPAFGVPLRSPFTVEGAQELRWGLVSNLLDPGRSRVGAFFKVCFGLAVAVIVLFLVIGSVLR